MRSLLVGLCVLAFAVVAQGVALGEAEVTALEDAASPVPLSPSESTMDKAMKSIPKNILALAMGKQAPAQPAAAKPMAPHHVVPKAPPKPARAPALELHVPKAVPQAASAPSFHILPSVTKLAAPSAPALKPIHVATKPSAALAAMAEMASAHHIQIPSHLKELGEHAEEKAHTPEAPVKSTAAKLSTHNLMPLEASAASTARLAAAVAAEKKFSPEDLAKATAPRKNSMGVVDGSTNSWQAYADKAPKKALNSKRTFLPPTLQEYKAPASASQLTSVDQIVNELHQAEQNSAHEKMSMSGQLKESIGGIEKDRTVNYKEDDSILKPAKTADEETSVRWPFGRPGLRDEVSLLQRSSGSDDDDIGDTNDDEQAEAESDEHPDLGESMDEAGEAEETSSSRHRQSDTQAPLFDYDPVQDMLQANGWSPSVLQNKKAASRVRTSRTESRHRGAHDEDADRDEGDEDEDEDDEGEDDDGEEDEGEEDEGDERDDRA